MRAAVLALVVSSVPPVALAPAPARADDPHRVDTRVEGPRFHADLTAAGGVAAPMSGGLYGGGGGVLGVDFGLPEISFGIAARYQHFARFGDGSQATELALAATGRATSTRTDGWALYGRLGLGFGVADGCFAGDFCGGYGFFASLELGANLVLGDVGSLDLGAELGVQTGLVNGVAVLWLPSVVVGLRL